jgi:hypothetical protein
MQFGYRLIGGMDHIPSFLSKSTEQPFAARMFISSIDTA